MCYECIEANKMKHRSNMTYGTDTEVSLSLSTYGQDNIFVAHYLKKQEDFD